MARSRERHHGVDAARRMVVTDLADQNLKKHIAAIHINNRLTLTQRKASNVLLYNAYESLLTARVHRIRVKDLAEAIGFNTHNLDPLKEALKTLARTVLEWNILDEDGAPGGMGRHHPAGAGGHQGRLLRLRLQPGTVRKALSARDLRAAQPQHPAQVQQQLRPGPVRELSALPADRHHRLDRLDILKRLLGIGETDGYYQDFRKFNDKVIKPAVRQVNDTSDLLLEIDYQRDHRKSRRCGSGSATTRRCCCSPSTRPRSPRPRMKPPVVDKPERSPERQEHLRDKLAACGLSARQIRMALASHAPDAIWKATSPWSSAIWLRARSVICRPICWRRLREDYRPAAAPRRMPSPEPAAADRAEETAIRRRCDSGTLAHPIFGSALAGGAGSLDPARARGAGSRLHGPSGARRWLRGAAPAGAVSQERPAAARSWKATTGRSPANGWLEPLDEGRSLPPTLLCEKGKIANP
jgi:hypothetical protein